MLLEDEPEFFQEWWAALEWGGGTAMEVQRQLAKKAWTGGAVQALEAHKRTLLKLVEVLDLTIKDLEA